MKTFSQSINLEENQRICVINMPVSYLNELAEIPEGAMVTPRPVGKFDKVVLFTNTQNELEKSWDRLTAVLNTGGEYIICHPDKKSRVYNEIKKEDIGKMCKAKKGSMGREFKILDGWKAVVVSFS